MAGCAGPLSLTSERRAPIGTRRLILRAPLAGDIAALARQINDPVIAGFTAQIPYPCPPIEARRFVALCAHNFGANLSANFLLALRSNPRLIVGDAGLTWKAGETPEIGIGLSPAIAAAALPASNTRTSAANFLQQRAKAVCAWVHMRNQTSQRLLKRAGFRANGGAMRHSRSLARYVPTMHLRLDRATWQKRQKRCHLADFPELRANALF